MASKPVQNITHESGFFLCPSSRGYLFSYLTSGYRYTLPEALYRVQPFKVLRGTLKTDRVHSRALARHSMAKKIFRRPKSHYTAPTCGFWIIKIFQFYFSTNQTAPVLAALRKTRTENIEKNFSVFHFYGSMEDLMKYVTIGKQMTLCILCEKRRSNFMRREAQGKPAG